VLIGFLSSCGSFSFSFIISLSHLNCDVRVWHGKTRDFIIDGTIYWV